MIADDFLAARRPLRERIPSVLSSEARRVSPGSVVVAATALAVAAALAMYAIHRWLHVALGAKATDAAALVVGLVTLYWLVAYTRAARDQVEASEQTASIARDQVEVAIMPCIVVNRFPADASITEHGIDFQNVGNGVALNLAYRVSPTDHVGKPLDDIVPGIAGGKDLSVFPANTALWIGVRRPALAKHARVVIDYDSMSGTKYRTTVTVTFGGDQRDFRFERVAH